MPLNRQVDRINKLEHITFLQNETLKKLACNFAWYWYNERLKCFAIIQKLNKDVAELVVFSSNWSGGVYIVDGSKMLVRDEETPDDELIKSGTWEPMMSLPQILIDFGKPEPEGDDESPESPEDQPPAEAAKSENLFKGKLAARK